MSITYIYKYNGCFSGRLKIRKVYMEKVGAYLHECVHDPACRFSLILLQEYNAGVGESHQRETCGSEYTSTGTSHSYIHKAAHIHQTHLCPGQCIDKYYRKA